MQGFPLVKACSGWVVVSAAVACGSGQSDALKRRITVLEDRVSVLGNENDALEARLAVLEDRQTRARPAPLTPGAAAEERPLLEVVKLEPPASERPDRPGETGSDVGSASGNDSHGARPVIRGIGNRLETHQPTPAKTPMPTGHRGTDAGMLPGGTGP